MIDGDFRSIVQNRDHARLKDYRVDFPDREATLHYLYQSGTDWLAKACVWGDNSPTPSSRPTFTWEVLNRAQKRWNMTLAGIPLADHTKFDLESAVHLWSIFPACRMLLVWLDWAEVALELGDIIQDDYEAPLRCIESKIKWCKEGICEVDFKKAHWRAFFTFQKLIRLQAPQEVLDVLRASQFCCGDYDYPLCFKSFGVHRILGLSWKGFNVLFTSYVLQCIQRGEVIVPYRELLTKLSQEGIAFSLS